MLIVTLSLTASQLSKLALRLMMNIFLHFALHLAAALQLSVSYISLYFLQTPKSHAAFTRRSECESEAEPEPKIKNTDPGSSLMSDVLYLQ